MELYIDADGCPVTACAASLARQFHIPCHILCDTAHVFSLPGADVVTVPKGPDSVDFALVNRVRPGDLVITQDYGLASMCLARHAYAMNQDGRFYTDDNIDALLTVRYTAGRIRAAGKRAQRRKGPAKRTAAQDKAFEAALSQFLTRNLASSDA